VGLSDGSTWKTRSGYAARLAVAVLDMRGSNPLSRSKRFTRGRSINYKNIVYNAKTNQRIAKPILMESVLSSKNYEEGNEDVPTSNQRQKTRD